MSNSQSIKTPKKSILSVLKNDVFWQTFLLSLIVTVIWQIYYPGLMSNDSIDQYLEAATGSYNSWHPPLMSIVLSAFLKMGGDIGSLILLQCCLAVFGLRNLISLLILFFSNQLISKLSCRWAATVVTILFLIPFLTPLMFFSIVFWKDSWLAIMLLWIVSYFLWLFLNLQSLTKKRFVIHILLLSLLSAAIILVRHNAVVIFPVFCLFFAFLGKIRLGKIGLITVGFLLLFAVILNPLVSYIFDVKSNNAGKLVLANDFAKMLRLYPELQTAYPLANRNQYLPVVCHNHVFIYWGINVGEDNADLKNEYLKALTTHRSELLFTRLYLFGKMLDSDSWQEPKLVYETTGNQYGLENNGKFIKARRTLQHLSQDTGTQWYFIWISRMHIVWIILNVLFLIGSLINIYIKRDRKSIFSLLLYLVPLSYYFSYVLAAVDSDYRYMYPSTLIMQAFVISLLLAKLLQYFQNRNLLEVA